MSETAAGDAGNPPQTGPPKVVYVMGSGRSGSSILGVALGNCQGFFYAGELDRWLPSGGIPSLGGTERTRFWSAVREQVDVPQDMLDSRARDQLERAGGLFRLGGRAGRRALRRRYRQASGQIVGAVADVAGVAHVVDTSHFPLRARELKAVEGIDVYLLFMVRDPQRVLASFTRTVPANDPLTRAKLILKTNLDLWLTHLLAIAVFLGHRRDRRLFLHYEDLTAQPQTVLRQILDMLGAEADLPDLANLRTGLSMGGNPMLRAETVALSGENRAPTGGSRLTALLQAPLSAVMARLRPAVQLPGGVA